MSQLTIVTPTFNRGYILEKLYLSLCDQNTSDFIWMIVDDGSTDNTKNLVALWMSEKKIKIEYYYKKNGGKHTALNLGLKLCKTPLFLCVDSDDILTNDAVDIILNYWEREDKKKILGIYGMQGSLNGIEKKTNWPSPRNRYIRMNELYSKYKYTGETLMVLRHDVIKNYTFPIYEDEKFITESAWYDKFDNVLPMRVIDEVLYLSEYLENGYTTQGMNLFFKNPKGYAYYLKQRALLSNHFPTKIKSSIKYYSWIKVNQLDDMEFNMFKLTLTMRVLGKFSSFLITKKYKKMRANIGYVD